MTKRAWVVLLLVFETTWLVYLVFLMPVAVQIITRSPRSELHKSLVHLSYVLPVAGVVTILAAVAGVYDIRDRAVSRKAIWVLAFVFFGVVAFPLYYLLHVSSPRRAPAA
jgi:hypothetical protein